MKSLCVAFFTMSSLCSLAHAENWPQWRGPAFNGSSSETGLPATFSKTEKMAWVCPLPGESAATPIIWEDRIFVSTRDDKTKELQALCISRKDGKILWKKSVGISLQPKASPTQKNTFASPSAVTDGEHVWFTFGTGEMLCCDLDGKEVWSKKLDTEFGPLAYLHGYSSSPLLLDKKLYLELFRRTHPSDPSVPKPDKPYESYMICLDAMRGKMLWRVVRAGPAKDGGHEAYTTPIPYQTNGKTEILAMGANALTAHDPATGAEIWRWAHFINKDDTRICCSPLVCNDVICVGESQRNPLLGVRPGGEGNLPEESAIWKFAEYPCNVGTPVFYKGLIYSADHAKKTLSCLESETGKCLWSGSLGFVAEIAASPTAADGKIYCMSEAGDIAVVEAGPQFKILSSCALEDPGISTASIAIAYKHLFIRTAKNLYCVGE